MSIPPPPAPPPSGQPLAGLRTVCLAANLPGPLAAAHLHRLGMATIRIEPPTGDQLARLAAGWYAEINEGATIVRLDLKTPAGRDACAEYLRAADVLITSHRRASLIRLGISAASLTAVNPELCWVEIVGDIDAPDKPGHDLTYQADLGLLTDGQMPRFLVADLAGAHVAVTAATALLAGRERGCPERHTVVGLRQAAAEFAAPIRHGLTAAGGPLSGSLPRYRVYRLADGYVACAALEPRFEHALSALAGDADLTRFFAGLTVGECRRLADTHDLPLAPYPS